MADGTIATTAAVNKLYTLAILDEVGQVLADANQCIVKIREKYLSEFESGYPMLVKAAGVWRERTEGETDV